MKFTLHMFDDRSFGLQIGRITPDEFKDLLVKIRAFPERRYVSDHSIWRIPATAQNIKYLRTTFTEDEYDIDPEARILLKYEELTDKRAVGKAEHRWEYLFNDVLPTVLYTASATTPFRHQTVGLDALHDTEYFGLLMEMGTGKTKVVVDECFWKAHDQMGDPPYKVLIVCPKTVQGVWLKEFEKHKDPNMKYWISRLGTQMRGMETLLEGLKQEVPLKVWIISYDSLKSMLEILAKIKFDLCVLDESTRIKNPNAQRTKNCLALRDHCKRRAILTGAPLVNNVLDLWSQFEFLHPGSLGFDQFAHFRNRYAHFIKSKSGYVKITGSQRMDELKENMAKHSFVVKKEQCLDLPPKTYVTREVEMSEKQADIYEQMLQFAMAALNEETHTIAKAAIAQLLRLSQICSGFMVDPEGKQHEIDGATNKLDALEEIIDEGCVPLLIWARFQYDIKKIESFLKKKGLRVGTIYGPTPPMMREKYVDQFNAGELDVIVGEAGTGGLGLTLLGPENNRCHTVVYYSNDFSLEKRLQSEDRCHRIGQTHPVTYIDLAHSGTIDTKIANVLQNKRDLSEMIKDMGSIRELLLGR